MKNITEKNWTIIIKPAKGMTKLNLKDLWRYRDLIKMFIKRDYATFYKQTILGPFWFIIQPLFTAGMFSFIFGKVANISTDKIPHYLFYMAGVINWSYFSESMVKTSDTFISNANIFGKVYFPRLTVPLSLVLTNMIRYFIQYLLFIIVFLFYYSKGFSIKPSWLIIFTPLILVYMAIMSIGFGIWVSSLTTKYRDLKYALPFFIQLWMYLSPVVYPLSLIPENYKIYFLLNPMTSVIEFFRLAYLGAGTLSSFSLFMSCSMTFIILITGIILFNRIEKTFMDTV